ncbi:VIT family protein [Henriciella sp. AS95]|uniref:VIT1/CCC1 transporter family protein n=1 Tax=Henriciella sp. AS95 TaxID=3135782 RepID=UPI003181227C
MSYDGHEEHHLMHRSNWLRAAVLGSNDGILSTASLLAGVAAASAGRSELLLVGVAALIAGAMSMAAGEYVSVSSQADTERADLAKEAEALKKMPEEELRELAEIYEARGVEPATALKVAEQLMEHDALDAHARDEIGISPVVTAQPLQAAVSSALSFAIGALLPLIAALLAPVGWVVFTVIAASLVSLALLGLFSAQMSGSGAARPVLRVVVWGAAAMAATALVGHLFGASV